MPDETLIVLTEQAQEIGKLEAETEQAQELLEELEEKVEDLERSDRNDNEWLRALSDRIYNLERELEQWKTKPQASSVQVETEELEESLTEEILAIPIPEVEEPAKEIAKKKELLSWLF